MIEILRRVALILGVYGAIVAFVHARPLVIEVALHDFAAQQARRPAWSGDREASLEAFIDKRTDGRRADVGGPAWKAVRGALDAAAQDRPLPAPYDARRGRAGRSLYYLPHERPVADVTPSPSDARPLVYARVTGGEAPAWLGLTRRIGREADDAPHALVRPLRRGWWIVLVVGLALYVVLPRRARGPRTLAYGLASGSIMPDVAGLLLGCPFFVLALMLVPEITDSPSMFVPEAWPAYLVLGVFVALAWTIHAWAAWFAAFRLDIEPDALHLRTLTGERRIRFADIEEVRLEQRKAPGWLRKMLFGAALIDMRAAGHALILEGREDAEFLVTETSGRRTRLRLTALEGAERVAEALGNR